MSDIISGLQAKLVTLFKDHKDANPDKAPQVIEAYGGQFENPKRLVRTMPALYVNLSNQFSLQADDIVGELLSGNYKADIILFDKNNLNREKSNGEMAVLIDWTISALRGKTIYVTDEPIPVAKNITGEYFPALNAVVLTLTLGAFDDE